MDMRDRSRKPDISQIARSIVEKATGEPLTPPKEKNPAAVALGRLGGLKGGPARAKKLSKQQLSEIGRKAVNTRWSRRKKQKKG